MVLDANTSLPRLSYKHSTLSELYVYILKYGAWGRKGGRDHIGMSCVTWLENEHGHGEHAGRAVLTSQAHFYTRTHLHTSAAATLQLTHTLHTHHSASALTSHTSLHLVLTSLPAHITSLLPPTSCPSSFSPSHFSLPAQETCCRDLFTSFLHLRRHSNHKKAWAGRWDVGKATASKAIVGWEVRREEGGQ